MTETNIYLPHLMRIVDITDESPGVKTFRLEFMDEALGRSFEFRTGQFGLFSAFGEGECTFCIASSPTRKGYIECTFREMGRVTTALANKEVGDTIGFRGPYGNVFPLESWRGQNLIFIAGGIALPPLRSVIWNCLDLRDWFETITVVYGARSVADLVYKRELNEWSERTDMKLVTTVDPGGETPEWTGNVGFVPPVVERLGLRAENAVAVVCGPPIMIKLTLPILQSLGFAPGQIFTTLENRMKCGLGKCGRCNTGSSFICKDGPVYTLEQLNRLPAEY